MRKSFVLLVYCICFNFSYAQNVGIGTTTPGSGLELRGPGLRSQQRITDPVSGNTLVLQSGAGSNLKVTGFNYGTSTAQPLYLSVDGANTFINPNSGNVGIGTTVPSTRLTVSADQYGIEHTDGVRSLSTFLNSTGVWIGAKSNHPLHFYTNDGNQQMTLTQAGQVGIGTTAPTPGYLLDVRGHLRSEGNSAHIVAKTTGGTNSWARIYMQSISQGWFIGTSQNFNGNQLYIGDENTDQFRLTIQPAGGPINLNGNVTQNAGAYGLPKAMVYLNSNGTIGRCYNGMSGATTGGCGFTSVRVGSGDYQINFAFDISSRFFAVSAEDAYCSRPVSITHKVFGTSALNIGVLAKQPNVINPDPTDLPVMVIVY